MIGQSYDSLCSTFGSLQDGSYSERERWPSKLFFNLNDDGSVWASLCLHKGLQGYPEVLHGGMIALLLDSSMTHCLFRHGIEAYTADLHVRYVHPVNCSGDVYLSASILKHKSKIYCMHGDISQEGRIMAWSDAKFVIRK